MEQGMAIVTGSAQGIGKAIAGRLSRDGFAVVINDLPGNQGLIDSTVEEIEASGGRAFGYAADVTIRTEVQDLVSKSTERLGPLRVMVANAGIGHADSIFELSEAAVGKVLDVNIKGVFNCYVVAGKKMLDQGMGGKIIGATSIAAFKPTMLISAYTASKWAVRGLTQCFAVELGDQCTGTEKITVNCYAPGIVGTQMWDALENKMNELQGPQPGGFMKPFAESVTTLKRVSTPEDVASVVGFLSGPDSDWVTGQTLVVDGGICFH